MIFYFFCFILQVRVHIFLPRVIPEKLQMDLHSPGRGKIIRVVTVAICALNDDVCFVRRYVTEFLRQSSSSSSARERLRGRRSASSSVMIYSQNKQPCLHS